MSPCAVLRASPWRVRRAALPSSPGRITAPLGDGPKPSPASNPEADRRIAMPFTIRVLDMEQGDCTLIRCPNGDLVMVECGSKSGFTDDRRITAQMAVREWTKNNLGAIDALILTHPDRDHYSEVGNILGEYTWLSDVQVGNKTIKACKFDAIDVLKI